MPHAPDDPGSGAWRPRNRGAAGPPDRQPRRYAQPSGSRPGSAPPGQRRESGRDQPPRSEPVAGRAPHPADPDPRHPHDSAVVSRDPRNAPGGDAWSARSRAVPNARTGHGRSGSDPVEPSGLDASPGADAARAFEAPEVGDGTRDFEDETQERIYAYVARHGGASADAVRDALGLGVERFTYHLEALRQQGYVEERDDGLHLSRTVAATERAPGTPTVVVRPATQSDLAGLVAVMREVTDERTHVVAESVAEQVAYEETVRRHTSAAARTFLVASVGDRESDGDGDGDGDAAGRRADEAARDGIVGWAHLTMPEVEKLAHTAELTVGVLDAYRRMGVGGALLERALERAAADGRHRVYQSLPATNRAAIGFLDAHGWRVEAVRENHYRIGGAFVDEVMMAIEL